MKYDQIWDKFLNLESVDDSFRIELADLSLPNIRKWSNRIYCALVARVRAHKLHKPGFSKWPVVKQRDYGLEILYDERPSL